MDKISSDKRSDNMRKIKSKHTKPELVVRKMLYSDGFRYRINVKNLPGTPDIVFIKKKIAIFINGCFWHCHDNCPKFRYPKSNLDYWIKKLDYNVERDKLAYEKLKNMGWKVIVIWECELKDINALKQKLYGELNE